MAVNHTESRESLSLSEMGRRFIRGVFEFCKKEPVACIGGGGLAIAGAVFLFAASAKMVEGQIPSYESAMQDIRGDCRKGVFAQAYPLETYAKEYARAEKTDLLWFPTHDAEPGQEESKRWLYVRKIERNIEKAQEAAQKASCPPSHQVAQK